MNARSTLLLLLVVSTAGCSDVVGRAGGGASADALEEAPHRVSDAGLPPGPPGTGGPSGPSTIAPCAANRTDGACRVFTATGGASAQNPSFSPDGSRLLFTIWHGGYNAGNAGLYVMPTAGGTASKVIDEGSANVNLPGSSWNAATNRITFSTDKDDGPDEIYTSNPDGSNPTRVTRHTSNVIFQEPSFSPDGTQITYEASYGEDSAEIWRVGVNGGSPVRLTQSSIDRQPNWSPAGDRILFQRMTSDWALYTMNADGSDQRRITDLGDSATDASWSPDGTRIVYSSSHGGLDGANLFVVAATGGTPVRVTNQPGYDGAVSWSPDGQWLAFESATDPGGESPTEIWRIRLK